MTDNCKCGHNADQHYPLYYWMTGCKIVECPCLDFEHAHLFPVGSKHCRFCDEPSPDTWEIYQTNHRDRI